MSRAVLITSCADPLLLLFCVGLLKKNCWDEFDKLYIQINNYAEISKEVQTELFSNLLDDKKIRLVYSAYPQGYGIPFTELVKICTEDLVCLLEDDGFIFQKGALDREFRKIESGEFDALGSPRFSCGEEISGAARDLYNLDYLGEGDKGPTFWPNFFFCKRKDLLKTDLDFSPKEFTQGKYFREIEHTMNNTEYGDTFVWMSLQLRALGLKIGEIPQFHSSPYEIDEYSKKRHKWASGSPWWIHGGSLSVGAAKYLNGVVPDASSDIAKQEMESRAAWWYLIHDRTEGFEQYAQKYVNGIEGLIQNAQLDRGRINQKVEIYKELLANE